MKTRTNQEWIKAFETYLKRRFPERSTAKHYVSDLGIFEAQQAKPLTEVTTYEVDVFVDQQRARGLATATVKRRAAALKTFFDFVAEETAQQERPNPVSLRRHGGRQPRRLPRNLSDAEAERLLEVVDNQRDLAMVCLMLYAGLRVGEVAGLRRAAITMPDDEAAPVRVRVMGKGRKERIAYLCREGYKPVADYLAIPFEGDAQQPIFRNRLGQPISISGIQNRMQHYAQKSGVAVTCHRLRHTYARWMAEGEVPLLALARLMGHTRLESTQRYIDGADPQVRRAYESAMARAAEPPETASEPVQESPQTAAITGSATVTRVEPSRFDGTGWMPDGPVWLREGCLAWIQHKWWQWKSSRRQQHARHRLRQLRIFWTWQLKQRHWQGWTDLQEREVIAFVDAQLARGLAAKTVVSILDTLYAVLRYRVRQGCLNEVPPRPKVTLPDALPRHLEPHEVVALETHVKHLTTDPSAGLDIALYYTLAHAGLRISEALDLQMHDLDLAAHRLYVREGKNRQDRVVFLTETATAALQAYLATVPQAPENVVFQWQCRPLSYYQAWKRIRDLGVAAGVPGVSPLRLRHTYATVLLNNGMTLPVLQKLMGHRHLTTTLIYARLADLTVEQQYRTAMAQATDNRVNSM